MKEYMLSVFFISGIIGVLSLIAYRGKNDPSKAALGIILVYSVFSPITELPSEFDFGGFIENGGSISESEHELVAEEAFAEGVALAVADEFSLDQKIRWIRKVYR